ncbi:MAG: SMP-30/gluconolactonase/LRE family protein, partial [Ignavibacteria bacterium]
MKKLFTLYSVLSLLFNESFAQSPVPDDAVLEKIAGGFQFVEGPVWNDTLGLLFSDMNGNKIYRWTEEDSAVIYLSPSANSNGLAYDLSGKLIIAQTGLRRMALRDSSGTIISIADTFNGKK